MRDTCCYDYSAILPLQAQVRMVELDGTHHDVINLTHLLDTGTNKYKVEYKM